MSPVPSTRLSRWNRHRQTTGVWRGGPVGTARAVDAQAGIIVQSTFSERDSRMNVRYHAVEESAVGLPASQGGFLIRFDEEQRASFLTNVRSLDEGFSDVLSSADRRMKRQSKAQWAKTSSSQKLRHASRCVCQRVARVWCISTASVWTLRTASWSGACSTSQYRTTSAASSNGRWNSRCCERGHASSVTPLTSQLAGHPTRLPWEISTVTRNPLPQPPATLPAYNSATVCPLIIY